MSWTPITTPPTEDALYGLRRDGLFHAEVWWSAASGWSVPTQDGDEWLGPIQPGQLISPEL